MTERMRWQYRAVSIGTLNTQARMGAALGHLGEDGWELVTIYDKSSNWLAGMENGFMMFKRPVPPSQEPTGAWAEVWNTSHLEALGTFGEGETPWA